MLNTPSPTISSFGYEIIRDHILSSILGKHEDDVLYWAGKELARKFPCKSQDELIAFFADACWGTLELMKESKDGRIFQLTNDPEILQIKQRSFRLEAGFIAEQIQLAKGYLTECYDEKREKQHYVMFTVKWDVKERIMNTIPTE
ncbi:YslB family protein [Lysinibacillus sp. FSL R7-0073]|uniref:YslB family protein n=1 Tax=Lysinibacillus TaxID=400634 RepID=UPI0018805881|nr:YslB family protein [Lysinibacillus fusiformis]MBD8522405.1 YslB family protein [Lysinibacillus fusiformis]MCR8852838.1 YslB family protein [Lysinibacillus fusiformis]MED4888727.1 YslB family protein [Lysinibacillus fusiformis]WKT75689.1 YslB family protein [Lysinibacillus fusiformis]